jgi:Zn-finger in ubiquitin-hydrolases and other protein
MTEPTCSHLDTIVDIAPSGDGCVECLASGTTWVHLRRCVACGHVGCCDSSPMKHATGHFGSSAHPIVQSFEPGEDWLWCFVDGVAFEIDSMTPGPSHT